MIQTNEMKKIVLKPDLNYYLDNFKKHILYVIDNYFKEIKIMNHSNIKTYYYDEYSIDTNVIENTYATLYIEIDPKDNIKNFVGSKNKKNNKSIVPEYYIDLKDIRIKLYEAVLDYFDENSLFWLDKYSIRSIFNVAISSDETKNYHFRIVPCFSYTNENGISGVIYYDDKKNEIEIEYPIRSKSNFKEKNIETNGAFRECVVICKNIYRKTQNITDYLPFEVFEILFYNIPNEFFKLNFNHSILGILNYIRNKNMKDFITLDEQDKVFTSKYKSFSLLYTKKVINILEKYVDKNIW